MLKKICNICGSDAQEHDYLLPMWADCKDGRGAILLHKAAMRPQTVHLCSHHAEKFADILYSIGCKI